MSEEDEYEIPLQDQRVFGAGIKRKRVKFVPSTSPSSIVTPSSKTTPAESVGDFYLKLVLPGDAISGVGDSTPTDLSVAKDTPASEHLDSGMSHICEICKLPLEAERPAPEMTADTPQISNEPRPTKRPHEASIAHQVCLQHSHPPSHLDRNRKGLSILSSYGWNPDSRLGLGASGQGIQFPIKTKAKDDTFGVGLVLPDNIARMKKEKPAKLDAGKVRKLQKNDKKKAERLRETFYRNDDVERYLGGS